MTLGVWLDRLFGVHCLLCRAPVATVSGVPLCEGCLEALPWNLNPCPRCATPLPPENDGLCGPCLRRPPPWDGAFAPLRYASPVDGLVQRFKFNGGLADGRLLSHLLIDGAAAREGERPGLIVPVPLHPARLRRRGFNQSLELARPLAEALAIPLDFALCARIRNTAVQSQLPAKARRANVRGAFALRAPLPAAHVALVDDVLTTGHTAAELTRLLKGAGAEKVEVWTVARAGGE